MHYAKNTYREARRSEHQDRIVLYIACALAVVFIAGIVACALLGVQIIG